jgi:4-hydroxy-tetrahydrodipicolinate reductase
MRLLLLGYGRMGRIVDGLSAEYGMEVVGRVDPVHGESPETWPDADVAIDFSVASAVPGHVRRLGAQGISVVIGTTGWSAEEADVRRDAAASGIGVVAAANFALGVNLFLALTERVAELMAPHGEFGAWIHEAHHAAKRDAPSGTALSLEAALRTRGYDRPLDVSSTRAGSIPGTHTVGFDAASETITLTHTARDRSGFARGALQAAQWVHGRSGWFSMRDVLGI